MAKKTSYKYTHFDWFLIFLFGIPFFTFCILTISELIRKKLLIINIFGLQKKGDCIVRKSLYYKLILLLSGILMLSSIRVSGQISFDFNSNYKYLKGMNAVNLVSDWYNPGFNDSGWASGAAPFHYGDGTGGTLLYDMLDTYTTVYMRSTFIVTRASDIEQITINADFDDGYILWINGNVVLSENAPALPAYDSRATNSRESGVMKTYNISASEAKLTEGTNYIAVQGFNTDTYSTDFYFGMSVIAAPALPRVITQAVFSHQSGFYSVPFTLTISSPLAACQVAYTLDGSNPGTSPTRVLGGTSVNILIDPLSSVNRPVTPAVIVRVALLESGFKPSFPQARTFIFTSEVAKQNYPGGAWPSTSINEQIIDLPMDSRVVNDSRYSGQIDFSLKSIPTISLITDIKYLFDADSGIYVNAFGHGEQWERECTAELLNPDGSAGFEINAGLRIRGGWSRHPNYPKHAFRLFFSQQFGASKLDFPLFGDEGTSKFDKIDLRCDQNYSWANAGWEAAHNTGAREVFSRDTQRDMGQPYSRSKYYHLYLNGMYWGLYQTQERTEANFAASYLGGEDVDYDVVKVNTENWNYIIEATDGNLDAWRNVYDLSNTGFASNTAYFYLEGKDGNGERIEGSPVLVDIDNLIDYMLVIFYTGNFDSPTSSFGQNKGANNFFAIYNKKLKNQGFKFFAHDAEHALMPEVCPPGTGLYEDRVNLGTLPDNNSYKMIVSSFNGFHPQWLHEKLMQNPEYRLRFADRATNYLKTGNVLSKEACLARFNVRASNLDYAIIAESARWGDSKGQFPVKTKDDSWIPELTKARNDYFPARSDILSEQLKTADLYPSVKPSIIKVNGITVQAESYLFQTSATIAFQNLNSGSDLYYTLDGSDPRLIGGAVSSKAIKWMNGSGFLLSNSASIKTRVIQAGTWSALNFTNILKTNEDYSKLKVTELMYHPVDEVIGGDTLLAASLEFIEFKNTGTTSINISGMVLDSAVHCIFPPNTLLEPHEFYVVASKPAVFTTFYGFAPSDNFSGNLSNGGEYVLLTDPIGNPVISFFYNDKFPWPVEPDGLGFTLNSTEKNPTGDPALYSYWKTSQYYHGTPMADDYGVGVKEEMADEVNLIIYPNPASDYLTVGLESLNYTDNFKVKIYTISGTLMYSETLQNRSTIDLAEYGITSGVYILRVEGEKTILSRKLIVTR